MPKRGPQVEKIIEVLRMVKVLVSQCKWRSIIAALPKESPETNSGGGYPERPGEEYSGNGFERGAGLALSTIS
jgi:hypothetical protein